MDNAKTSKEKQEMGATIKQLQQSMDKLKVMIALFTTLKYWPTIRKSVGLGSQTQNPFLILSKLHLHATQAERLSQLMTRNLHLLFVYCVLNLVGTLLFRAHVNSDKEYKVPFSNINALLCHLIQTSLNKGNILWYSLEVFIWWIALYIPSIIFCYQADLASPAPAQTKPAVPVAGGSAVAGPRVEQSKTERDILDTEIDMHRQSQSGEDTSELQKKLNSLHHQVSQPPLYWGGGIPTAWG